MAGSFEAGGYGKGDQGSFDPIAANFLDSGNLIGYEFYMRGRHNTNLSAMSQEEFDTRLDAGEEPYLENVADTASLIDR